jgi:hypothetical protein
MHQRDQLLEGTLVAPSPFEQEPGDFRRVFSNPAILCAYADDAERQSEHRGKS